MHLCPTKWKLLYWRKLWRHTESTQMRYIKFEHVSLCFGESCQIYDFCLSTVLHFLSHCYRHYFFSRNSCRNWKRFLFFLKNPPHIKALDAMEAKPKGIICALKKGMTVVVSESGRILCIFFFFNLGCQRSGSGQTFIRSETGSIGKWIWCTRIVPGHVLQREHLLQAFHKPGWFWFLC